MQIISCFYSVQSPPVDIYFLGLNPLWVCWSVFLREFQYCIVGKLFFLVSFTMHDVHSRFLGSDPYIKMDCNDTENQCIRNAVASGSRELMSSPQVQPTRKWHVIRRQNVLVIIPSFRRASRFSRLMVTQRSKRWRGLFIVLYPEIHPCLNQRYYQ